MPQNIVKEILLKFKGDTRDVEKNVKRVEQTLTSLQKTVAGSGQGASFGYLNRTIEKFAKTAEKFGVSINKDMTKFQKAIQEVAQRDLQVLQRQTDGLFRKTEDRLRRLKAEEQRLEQVRAGGTAAQIAAQERRVAIRKRTYAGAEARFAASAEEFSVAGAGIPAAPGMGRRIGIGLGALGAVAGLGGGAIELYQDTIRQREQTKAVLSRTLLRRKMAAYSGDITEALLESKEGALAKSQAYADRQTSAEAWKRGLWGAAGLAAIAAAPFTGGLSLGAFGLAGAAAGGLRAAGGAIPFFFGGGREEFREQQRQEQYNRLRDESMTAAHFQYLFGKAPTRYEFQRVMQMEDPAALRFRTAARQMRFGEEEASQTAMTLRQTFGNVQGAALAQQAMGLARGQGMNLQTATNLVQTAAFTGGQGRDVKQTLTEIYTDAFSKGITDSGLIEVFQKGLVDLAAKSPDITDLGSMASRITANLDTIAGGRTIGARDVQGAMQAQQILGDISMQGGETGFTKMTTLAQLTRGNTMATAFLANRTDEEIFQLARNKDPRLMGMLGEEGVSKLEEQYDPAKTLARKFRTTTMGREALEKAKQGLREGRSLSQVITEGGAFAEVLGGTGKISKEAAAGVYSQVLTSEAKSDTALQKLMTQGRMRDITQLRDTLMTPRLIQTPEQREEAINLLTRQVARDIAAGKPTDYLREFGDVGQQVMQTVMAKGQIDPNKTVAGAIIGNIHEGEKQQDTDASKAVTAEEAARLGIAVRAGAVAPGAGISASVDNLVAALRSFADSVKSQSGSSATNASSGGQ